MPTLMTEEGLLRNAITTMLAQICKVGVSYTNELSIEGTIGVTIDHQRVFVVHFDDHIVQSLEEETDDTTAMAPPTTVTTSESEAWTNADMPQHAPTETFSSLLTNDTAVNMVAATTVTEQPVADGLQASSKMMRCLKDSTSSRAPSGGNISRDQTLNERIAIDIDSDSYEGFPLNELTDELTGQAMNNESLDVQHSSASHFSAEAERKFAQSVGYTAEPRGKEPRGALNQRKKGVKKGRGRNVIVIEDNDMFAAEAENDALEEAESDMIDSSALDFKSFTNISPTLSYSQQPSDQYVNYQQAPPTVSSLKPIRQRPGPEVAVRGGAKRKSSTAVVDTKKSESEYTSRHTCDVCLRTHRSASLLESHLVSAHNIVEHSRLGHIAHFSCTRCQRRFRFRAQLDKHSLGCATGNSEETGTGFPLRPHRCAKCRNAYRHSESLRLHARTHDVSNVGAALHCDVCTKTYANRVLFQKHIVYKHERLRVGNYTEGIE